MPYTPTTWVNDSLPAINAENLNKIEAAIASLFASIEASDPLTQYALKTYVASLFSTHNSSSDHDARYIRTGIAAPVSVSSGSSPLTIQNTDSSPWALYMYGGTVSNVEISHNSSTWLQVRNSTGGMVIIPPGHYARITYSSAPTLVRQYL